MSFEAGRNYIEILQVLKEKIRQARLKASFAVNRQLLELYWEIGTTISLQEKSGGWGAKIVDTLARDLKIEFPDMTGFSKTKPPLYEREFGQCLSNFATIDCKIGKQ